MLFGWNVVYPAKKQKNTMLDSYRKQYVLMKFVIFLLVYTFAEFSDSTIKTNEQFLLTNIRIIIICYICM